jgi:hypothetical protein
MAFAESEGSSMKRVISSILATLTLSVGLVSFATAPAQARTYCPDLSCFGCTFNYEIDEWFDGQLISVTCDYTCN